MGRRSFNFLIVSSNETTHFLDNYGRRWADFKPTMSKFEHGSSSPGVAAEMAREQAEELRQEEEARRAASWTCLGNFSESETLRVYILA